MRLRTQPILTTMKERWLDELAHAGPEHLDPGYVAAYERKAGYDATADVDALRHHGLTAGDTVIDMGAGVGTFAAAIAPFCREVIAVDVSPAMIQALRERVERHALTNVKVVRAGFLSYEHAGPPAAFVFSRNALHQIPDFWKGIALHRIAAMLRPGGILRVRDLVYDFDPADVAARIEEWLSGAVSDSRVGWTADELAEHVRSEFSTYSSLFELLLERTGFEVLEREYRRNAYAAYTCRLINPG